MFLDTASLATLHVSAGDAAGCSKKGFIGVNLPLQRMSFADSTCFHPEKNIWEAFDGMETWNSTEEFSEVVTRNGNDRGNGGKNYYRHSISPSLI